MRVNVFRRPREAVNALPIAAELASMKRGLYREIALQQTRFLRNRSLTPIFSRRKRHGVRPYLRFQEHHVKTPRR